MTIFGGHMQNVVQRSERLSCRSWSSPENDGPGRKVLFCLRKRGMSYVLVRSDSKHFSRQIQVIDSLDLKAFGRFGRRHKPAAVSAYRDEGQIDGFGRQNRPSSLLQRNGKLIDELANAICYPSHGAAPEQLCGLGRPRAAIISTRFQTKRK
jgi:hypothetical protein